jgi:hypothetical protein
MKGQWLGVRGMQLRKFICTHCGEPVQSRRGWPFHSAGGGQIAFIYICPTCKYPKFFASENDRPDGPVVGPFV